MSRAQVALGAGGGEDLRLSSRNPKSLNYHLGRDWSCSGITVGIPLELRVPCYVPIPDEYEVLAASSVWIEGA